MAIATVQIQLNGSWHTLTYNSSSGKYEGSITAPNQTSYHQPDHVFAMTVKAVNTAGTEVLADSSHFSALNLRVLEKLAPTITITSPGQGAYVSSAQQPIVFQLRDESGGSGVDLASLTLVIDGGTALTGSSPGMVCNAVTNGYDCTYTPQAALADGSHSISIQVADYDGNAAEPAGRSYTQDTVPPVLNVSSPADNFLTNVASLVVAGTTNDVTSSPVTVTIALDGADQGGVTVASDGSFSKSLNLVEGLNTIVITATDSAGKASTVTIRGTVDTSQPEITAVEVAPNPLDAGTTMVVKVTVSG